MPFSHSSFVSPWFGSTFPGFFLLFLITSYFFHGFARFFIYGVINSLPSTVPTCPAPLFHSDFPFVHIRNFFFLLISASLCDRLFILYFLSFDFCYFIFFLFLVHSFIRYHIADLPITMFRPLHPTVHIIFSTLMNFHFFIFFALFLHMFFCSYFVLFFNTVRTVLFTCPAGFRLVIVFTVRIDVILLWDYVAFL